MRTHPNSLAMKSAQFMTDARRLDAILTDMQTTGRKEATEDERAFLRSVWNRMPEPVRAELRPSIKRLGFNLD